MAVKTLAIIVNPRAGGGEVWRRVAPAARRWRQSDWRIEVYETQYPAHASQIVRSLLVAPPDRVAICGGDGTVNEVLNSGNLPPFPLAVIPAGTANVLARELRVPLDPIRALDAAATGRVLQVDLGVVRCPHPRYFLLMAGVGFDASVVSKTPLWLKRLTGVGAYYFACAKALLAYRFPEFRVVAGDESLTATSCVIANSRGYGGELLLTPNAEMTDGIFDLLALQGRPKLGYVRLLLAAWRRVSFDFPWAKQLRARQIRIEGPSTVPVQVDGELCGRLPISVEILPSSISFVVP